MRLPHKNLLTTLASILCFAAATQAMAEPDASAKQYVLRDSFTGKAQANTPYFLFFPGETMQAAPLMTDAKGRTQPFNSQNPTISSEGLPLTMNLSYQTGKIIKDFNNPDNNNILVKAQGMGSQVFIMTLAGLSTSQSGSNAARYIPGGTSYVIWNRAMKKALCGKTNVQGYSNAYFVDDSKSWYDNRYAFLLKGEPSCNNVSKAILDWVEGQDTSTQQSGEQFVKQHFDLTEAQFNQAYKILSFK